MSEELKRNPYTGMDMAKENTGNGEVVKVEDLINDPTPEWKQYEPIDTLTNHSDEELSKYHSTLDDLAADNDHPNMPESISVEDLMNTDKKTWEVRESSDSVLKDNPIAQMNHKTQGYEWDSSISKKSNLNKDDLSLNNDELINSLTNILG